MTSENLAAPPPLIFSSVTGAGDEIILLEYLNHYGMDALLQAEIIFSLPTGETITVNPDYKFPAEDLTNDDQPEMIYINLFQILIIGCREEQYQTLLNISENASIRSPQLISIQDSNQNGIPETTFLTGWASQGGHGYRVFEWDGTQFQNILADSYLSVNTTGEIAFEDRDGSGIQELIVTNGVQLAGEVYQDFGPWRNVTRIYKWNGSQYVFVQEEWDSPEYRFQAVQDGDRLFLAGKYDRALAMYQQAITSDKFKWWRPELRGYMMAEEYSTYGTATLPSPPVEDKNEYIALSAYSYFRIMLVYLAENQPAYAHDIYQVIQSQYANDPYGKPFAEMATTFWEEYTATQNIASACQEATFYAKNHQNEILPYLGNTSGDLASSAYHGEQSLNYVPESICPVIAP